MQNDIQKFQKKLASNQCLQQRSTTKLVFQSMIDDHFESDGII